MSGHDIAITVGDHRGVPLRAECECGQWSWARPDGDRWADTLPVEARAHHRAVEVEP